MRGSPAQLRADFFRYSNHKIYNRPERAPNGCVQQARFLNKWRS